MCSRSCGTAAGVGDTGPGGGIIFHVNQGGFLFFEGIADAGVTRHYLEVATANITGDIWAVNNETIADLSTSASDFTDWAIGRGMRNTLIISNQPYQTPAADVTFGFHGNGTRNDWFLPSKDELDELAQYRGQFGIPNSGEFWSSSQWSDTAAWTQNFGGGNQGGAFKTSGNNIRAIRAF
jgi:hypothetical protein